MKILRSMYGCTQVTYGIGIFSPWLLFPTYVVETHCFYSPVAKDNRVTKGDIVTICPPKVGFFRYQVPKA